jgi:hypothetical protein
MDFWPPRFFGKTYSMDRGFQGSVIIPPIFYVRFVPWVRGRVHARAGRLAIVHPGSGRHPAKLKTTSPIAAIPTEINRTNRPIAQLNKDAPGQQVHQVFKKPLRCSPKSLMADCNSEIKDELKPRRRNVAIMSINP